MSWEPFIGCMVREKYEDFLVEDGIRGTVDLVYFLVSFWTSCLISLRGVPPNLTQVSFQCVTWWQWVDLSLGSFCNMVTME